MMGMVNADPAQTIYVILESRGWRLPNWLHARYHSGLSTTALPVSVPPLAARVRASLGVTVVLSAARSE